MKKQEKLYNNLLASEKHIIDELNRDFNVILVPDGVALLCGNGKTIFQAYESPPQRKIKAYEYCEKLAQKYDYFSKGITGHNCMQFTYEFDFVYKGYCCHAKITKDYNWLYVSI